MLSGITVICACCIGSDYIPVGVRPESGESSNLRWNAGNISLTNDHFNVNITSDNIPEPVEVFEVVLVCEINCFPARKVYSVTIIDDLGG